MLKRYAMFCFEAKLKYIDRDEYYIVPFRVLAVNRYRAEAQLWDFLSNPEQTGYKYEECVGLVKQPTSIILMDKTEVSRYGNGF